VNVWHERPIRGPQLILTDPKSHTVQYYFWCWDVHNVSLPLWFSHLQALALPFVIVGRMYIERKIQDGRYNWRFHGNITNASREKIEPIGAEECGLGARIPKGKNRSALSLCHDPSGKLSNSVWNGFRHLNRKLKNFDLRWQR
jgi:hypothetical protein